MIRTMVGLAFSLILLLSYAVYGATMNPDYYVYQNLQDETEAELNLLDVGVLNDTGDGQITRWIWTFTLDPHNLTWINASVANASSNGDFKMINVAGEYWSHEKLSNPDAKDFICAEEIHEGNTSYWIEFDCKVSTTNSVCET